MNRLLTTHVETHLDALEILLPLRAQAEVGRDWILPRVLELDERIAAHAAALQLFGEALSRVIAPFLSQHPVAVAFLAAGQRPDAQPLPETSLQTQARLADSGAQAPLAEAAWNRIAVGDATGFSALADLGRPADVEPLIDYFLNDDVRIAVAAGRVFSILTGGRCEGTRRVTLAPIEGHPTEAFEQAFLEQAWLPEQKIARAQWAALRPVVAHAARINRGFIVDDAAAATHAGLDRREVAAAALRFRRRENP